MKKESISFCEICKAKVKGLIGLSQHLKIHKDSITAKEYYLKYIDSSFDVKCSYCEKEKEFEGLYGFNTTCGNPVCVKRSHDEKMAETCKQKKIKKGTYIDKKFECPICHRKFPYEKSVITHVGKEHIGISMREYYLTYVNKNAETKCSCGKDLLFYNIVKGFRSTCGDFACRTKHRKELYKKNGGMFPFESKEHRDKVKLINIKIYGTATPGSLPIFREKAQNTFKSRTGFLYPAQSPIVVSKAHLTKKKNGTYGKSKPEDNIWEYVSNLYGDAIRNYKNCEIYDDYVSDIFIKSLNLFIEVQGFPTHGDCAFDPNNIDHINKLTVYNEKLLKNPSGMYNSIIRGWTVRDVRKRELSIKHGFNLLEIFEYEPIEFIKNQIDRVINGLSYRYNIDQCKKEIAIIKESYTNDGYTHNSNTNKTILSFQPTFYRYENNLWKNPIIRRKIIENRMKYLNKRECELTDRELLRGFKISGVHHGFSHFSPFWIKKFIKDYNIHSVYDPCGGWGHRLLGSMGIKYIYNDINNDTYNGVCNMVGELELCNVSLYNGDATTFVPHEDYECVFTCPPYFNIEDYGNKVQWDDYYGWKEWFSKIVDNSMKSCVKYFAFVMTSKYSDDLIKICKDKGMKVDRVEKLGTNYGNHLYKSKHSDLLVVFKIY